MHLLLATAACTPAAAQSTAALAEQLIANVRANHVDRGEAVLVRQPDGDWWIAAVDAHKLRIPIQESARRTWDKEPYYSLFGLGAVSLSFDEAALSLDIVFPQVMLPETRIDLSNRPPPVPRPEEQMSLVMSYRLSMRPNAGNGATAANLLGDLNVRVGKLLLRQEMRLDRNPTGDGTAARRGPTQAVWDDLGRGTRLVLGDTVSSAGAFGSAISAAGLSYSRLFQLTPDVVWQPTAGLRTSAGLPSEVEVAVDGTTVYRSRVPPGPLVLDNLLQYGGSRTVRLTITDSTGRREVYEQPFLFTDAVLAEGLHEFNYFVGRRSALASSNRIDYLEPAWQGFHRHGVSDSLTLSAGGEGGRGFTNAGIGAAWRSNLAGLFAGELLASRDRDNSESAMGWAGRYTYQTLLSSIQLGRRQYGAGFRTFGTSRGMPFLRNETAASLSTRVLGGVLALAASRQTDDWGTRRSASMRFGKSFPNGVSVSAELLRMRTPTGPQWSAHAYLRINLDREHWATATSNAAPGIRVTELATGKQLPSGEGIGWRLGTTHTDTDEGSATAAFGSASWTTRHASIDVYARSPSNGASSYVEGVVSGAFVAANGWAGFTRPIRDGFAVARLGVPQPGISILLNNQLQGTTDEDGTLLIPNIGSYGRQTLSLDEKELGLEFLVPEKNKAFSIPYKGGATIDFGAHLQRALAGPVWLLEAGHRTRLSARELTLSGPGGPITITVSRGGEFYIENVEPGTYTGSAEIGGRTVRCKLAVPRGTEPVSTSKEGLTCE
ncbi:fimbria/pilus outer membrane usher protein [Ramlibacter sp.]|uniref:fimbria/pilus outer membrane usher protein n=1 Tax=Ramlibacter sp. TaxID=1917967 RepID=UPI002FC7996C